MGIGGQGISAVAQMVLEAERENVIVTGCDMQASATTRALERIGVPVQIGHCADHLADIDRLIVVPAALVLNPDHPELAMARARGIPMITWQEMLGELMHKKCVLSVSGVHGKGTTTALLSLILVDAGLDPTCEVGAVVPRFGFNYRLGKSRYFVNEADEFYNNFWHYHPRVAVITSIEFEHPEFFADYAEFLASFEHFVRGMDIEGDWPVPSTLIVNADSPGCFELLARLHDWPGRVVTYRVIQKERGARPTDNKQAILEETRLAGSKTGKAVTNAESISSNAVHSLTFEAYDVKLEGETSFRVRMRGSSEQELPTLAEDISILEIQTDNGVTCSPNRVLLGLSSSSPTPLPVPQTGSSHLPDGQASCKESATSRSVGLKGSIRLQLSGVHNVQNALAAFTAASILGIDTHTIIQTLEGFTGIRRRFEIRNTEPIQVNGQPLDVILVDDYAHHPTAIAATLEAAHRRYPTRRLIAVYQPHMYSRTKTFFEQFLHAFDLADVAMIADIFPARERDTGLISSPQLVEAMAQQPHFQQHGQVIYSGNVQSTAQQLGTILRDGDLVLIMGAGDIYTLTDILL